MAQYSDKEIARAVSGEMKKGWKLLLVIGVLTLVLGIIGMGMNVSMTIVSILYIGVFVLFGAVLRVVDAVIVEGWKNKLFAALMAFLYLTAGSLMIRYPAASAAWFTLFIAAFFIVVGISRLIIGFWLRGEARAWAWTVFYGAGAVILGILIYIQWPVSGLWVIGLFVSIELIMQGISTITMALAARSLQRTLEDAV